MSQDYYEETLREIMRVSEEMGALKSLRTVYVATRNQYGVPEVDAELEQAAKHRQHLLRVLDLHRRGDRR